jgi:hypothetical protein
VTGPETNRTLYLLNDLARFNEVSPERRSNYARNSLETRYGCTLSERIFWISDCLASAQSCANQFGHLGGVIETTFSHRVAIHSPFDWTGNRTAMLRFRPHSPGPLSPDKRLSPCNSSTRRHSVGASNGRSREYDDSGDPSLDCVGTGSPFAAQIANARSQFDSQFTATSSFQTANVPVQVTGVGFFHFFHNQHGVLSLEYGPVYLWLACYCWAARGKGRSAGVQEMGIPALGLQRYVAE